MAGVGFAPDAEEACETVVKLVTGGYITLDGEPDRGRRAGIGAAFDAPTVFFAQHSGDQGKFAAAAGDVKSVDVRVSVAIEQITNTAHGVFHQRTASFIELG